MSSELNNVKQQLAYQTGLNDGMRQGGIGQRGFFGGGMGFVPGLGNSFLGGCARWMGFSSY